jgi:hypothetical protein
MAYQFIHYETYNAIEARKEINEGLRAEGFCPHVHNPQEPQILYGKTEGLADKIDALKASTKRQVTQLTRSKVLKTFERSIRDSEDVVLFGIASWPRKWSEENPRLYAESKNKTVEKLKKQYGNQLQAVVFHDDEEHPHLHFWVIPDNLEMFRVCPATAAEKALDVSKSKSTSKMRMAVRSQALKTYQKEWHHEVFASAGLAKEGPRRRRMTRVEWKAESETLNTVAKINLKADDTRKHLAGVTAAMLSQNHKHQTDIAAMNAKASAMQQGMTNAQRIEVAKQLQVVEVVNDLLGI